MSPREVPLLPLWEKVSPKATDEGCSSLALPHSVAHPSSVSALRADPPSPTRGEGKGLVNPCPDTSPS
ncbi:hypothetical protein EJ071_27840 [Mesorhizobium sp. M1B.F.Ca.ET.045.04.1.1]|nr:hypothetical protein EJ071_27840 [Mesorhizobium sp. M1B.F.Ca.ET.045.04.1.1]